MVDVIKDLITKAEFDKVLNDNERVAVDFYADWCGPCRMISPKFENFSIDFTNIKFVKVNVDTNSDVAESEKISAMPTFKFYKNGKQVTDLVGASEAKLKEKLETLASC